MNKGSKIKNEACEGVKEPMSKIRRQYMARFVCRCVILVICALLFFLKPSSFDILNGMNFFRSFSPFHLLWGVWIFDMLCQLMPIKGRLPLGTQKLFKEHFKPIRDKINYQALRSYVISTTKAAYKVFLLWTGVILIVWLLHRYEIINDAALLLLSVIFYVCDLICVLFFCPFRLIMKNRCCTTCRIFNWDHLMMFTPMLFVFGFFSYSLLAFAAAAWIVWELCVMMYPERFWENSNEALKCSQCTDKLCTQYCRKLRQRSSENGGDINESGT